MPREAARRPIAHDRPISYAGSGQIDYPHCMRARRVAKLFLSARRERHWRGSWERKRAVVDHLPASFAVARMDVSGAPGLAVRGELDIAVASWFEATLDAAIRESVGAFVLDLCDVEFLDSSGLAVVMRARALLAREERALAVVCLDGSVRRLFDHAGVADLLFLYCSCEEVARELLPAA